MPNNYNSSFSGQHNDEYDARIAALENFRQTFLNTVYPVGSIYMSMNETDPGTLFSGTWERISGRFLLGCGGAGPGTNNYNGFGLLTTDQETWFSDLQPGSTGGEYQHTLSAQEMPAHSHLLKSTESATNNGQGWSTYAVNYFVDNGHYLGTTITGETWSHNNMPPYLTVAMWKRIA